VDTGTDATRAVTPDGLQASHRNIRYVKYRVLAHTVDCEEDDSQGGTLIIPFSGTIVQSDTFPYRFSADVDTAGTGGTMVVDLMKNGTTIMTTNKLDIETGEKTTATAATQPDVTTTSITAGDAFTFDITAEHSTNPAKGLTICIPILED
jgi:hypothetical protein